MIIKQSKRTLTYIVFGVFIFSILKLLPNNNLNNIDTMLITIITVGICALVNKDNKKQHCVMPKIKKSNNSNEQFTELLKKIGTEPFISSVTSTQTKPTSPLPFTKQITATPDKISFPFSEDYMKSAMNDILKSKDDQQLATKVRANAKSNVYYEIFVQLIQTNVDAVYRLLKKDFNKVNEVILDIKIKRENDMANPIKIDGKDLSISGSRELSNTVSSYLNKMTKQGKYIDPNGFIQNIVDNDMRFTMFSPTQHEKLGTYDASFTNEWKNDYALLNTDKWRPPLNHSMYKCKTEKKCPVCPSMTTGYPVKVKDFDIARKILAPDLINTDYINEKLNAGLA
jgi:hypothetical protein